MKARYDDLEKALQLSQQEAAEKERKNREKLDKETADNLFGSGSSSFQAFPQQQTFVNNPYQQQQQQQAPLQLEWAQPTMQFSEPVQNNPYQQQQQQNPYLSNQFNANGLQAQMTGFPQQQQPPLQAQMTGFPQQQPQFLQQPSFQTSMVTGTNPFSQMSQQQQQPAVVPEQKNYDYSELVFGNPAPSRPQQQQSPVFGSNTPNFGSNTPHFGSNTPNFSFSTPATATASPSPAFATTTTTATQFSPSPAFANTNAFAAPSPSFAQANATASPHMSQRNLSPKPTEQDAKYSKLNALLANNDDGLDSYGNRGNLRIPYGTGFANSLPLQPKNNDMLAITDGSSTTASPQPFGQQTSRNPFGQANTTPSNERQGQKSLLEMMQEQKQQQQQFATFNNNTSSLF
ncbi:hypothetical protein G6F42_019292 [Rhizopus arrhizus]|nr:hypothetical protein G6F42_019292 [Rhizopus arrhizus]